MNPVKKGIAGALLSAALFPLAAQAELHGSLETFHAFPFSRDLDLTDSRTAFTGEIAVYAGEAADFVSLSAEYNGVSRDRGGFSLGEAWLGEAWIDWNAGGLRLRLGRQLLSWGAADGLVLTDVVCPQNLTAYAGLDFAGGRLAVDGLKLRYSFPVLAVEALWLPLFTPARLPGDGNPLREIFYPPSVDVGPARIPVSYADPVLPRAAADGEYGLRVSCYTSALDFSFMGFCGWNDIPWISKTVVPSSGSTTIEVTPGYGRTITAGFDAAIPLGEVLLRLETAWTGGGRYDRPPEESAALLSGGYRDDPVEQHNLKLLAGIDWNPSGWSLSAQYYEDLLPGAYRGGTARSWRKTGLTLGIAKAFFREPLDLSAWGYLDLQDFDAAGSVSAAYALTDALSFALGSDFFTGGIDDRGTYAVYKDLSCLWIKGIFRF
ncbi:MAG: hypothetical protein LBF95_02025 [Treponema sp.]|jgi:hypothetical protein|nr:hypothetical protein [Treponema sp.]